MRYVLTSHVEGEDEEIVSNSLPFLDAKVVFAHTLKMPVDEIPAKEGEEQTYTLPTGEEVTLRPAYPDEMLEVAEDGTLMLDNIIADYSQERLQIAFDRAVAEFGGLVADHDDEDFVEAYTQNLKVMALTEVMGGMTDQGMVESCGVNEDGEIRYQAAA